MVRGNQGHRQCHLLIEHIRPPISFHMSLLCTVSQISVENRNFSYRSCIRRLRFQLEFHQVHDSTIMRSCCLTCLAVSLNPVYTIQPVVNAVVQRFDNRLYRVNKHPTGCQSGCQTGLTTGLTTVLNEQQLFVQPVVKPGCTTV